jgi:hypothetical protein
VHPQIFADPAPQEQKGGRTMNIFAKRNENRVEVPEIEVNGNEATVQTKDDVWEQDRTVKLPKTKWF